MRIGIDASNIGGGGGVTHLKEILTNYLDCDFEHESIEIFASSKVLDNLPCHPSFMKTTFSGLNGSLIKRIWFQKTKYDKEIEKRCDILYSVAGDYIGSFKPVVSMSRNMLLYERKVWKEIKSPIEVLRFYLNFLKQKICFKNSLGIIFISNYARKVVSEAIQLQGKELVIINHGISQRFINEVRPNREISSYDSEAPFTFLYISGLHVYKHQWQVVKAVSILKERGYNVRLELIGGVYYKPSLSKLMEAINASDPNHEFIKYHGHVNYDAIHEFYQNANAIIFASTCENMPNILIESMASGLPIACSNHPPMPEFLKENGFYFDSYNLESIVASLEKLMHNRDTQVVFAANNLNEIKNYSWKTTTYQTFKFIEMIYAFYILKK